MKKKQNGKKKKPQKKGGKLEKGKAGRGKGKGEGGSEGGSSEEGAEIPPLLTDKTFSQLSTVKSSPCFSFGSLNTLNSAKTQKIIQEHRKKKISPGALTYSAGVQKYFQIGRTARAATFGATRKPRKQFLETIAKLKDGRPGPTSYTDGTAKYFRFGGKNGTIFDSTYGSVKTSRFGPGLLESMQKQTRPKTAPLRGERRRQQMLQYTLPNTRERLEHSQKRSTTAANSEGQKVQTDTFQRAPSFVFGPGFGKAESKSKIKKQPLSSSTYRTKFGIKAKNKGAFAPPTSLNAKQLERLRKVLGKDQFGHGNFLANHVK